MHCKKEFQVTGPSNVLGGHEDYFIRDDTVRKEIGEIIGDISVIIWGFSQKKKAILIRFQATLKMMMTTNCKVERLCGSNASTNSVSSWAPDYEPL